MLHTSSRVCSAWAGSRIVVDVHCRSRQRRKGYPMRSLPLIAGAMLVLAACTDRGPVLTEPHAITGTPTLNIVSETSTDLWARVITGETGPGSMYQLYLPREWNGAAVFYAHGFRDVLEPVSLRNQDNLAAIRDQLGERGIAVAYSSYSENGYAEKDGVQRTHQL